MEFEVLKAASVISRSLHSRESPKSAQRSFTSTEYSTVKTQI